MSQLFRLFTILFLGLPQIVLSQSGVLLKGIVEDAHLGISLSNASITVVETQDRTRSDSVGFFKLVLKKPGNYHLGVSHLGCENLRINLSIKKDTFITISLEHYHQHIGEVKVKGRSSIISDQISNKMIVENSNLNLSTLLENSNGVQSIRNGSGIAKPIIHGLYGNRLSILNNGIAQTGQQWGNDHAPEIDPLNAGKIRIIKGISALEYKGINMGALISIEPENIKQDPHIHGQASAYYETNGRGYGTNVQIEQNYPTLGWKIGATYKKNGDKSTPDYYLRNTGSNELNLNLQLEKLLFRFWQSKLYFSSFNTELGVLRGSHISNLTDLQSAMSREVPYFTESDFSSRIVAPKQAVNHQFLKVQSVRQLNQIESIGFVYSGQLNNRKEYDVRRSGRSEIPALFIIQHTHYFEIKYSKLKDNVRTKLGLQTSYVENINQAETGILPLIPNYSSLEPGIFFTKSFYIDHSNIDLGARYDFLYQNIYPAITGTNNQGNTTNSYHNGTVSLAYQYSISPHTKVQLNSGLTLRNPAINELFSFGLHQGISSIEEGNSNLNSEKSFKTSLDFSTHWKESVFFECTPYFHNINDFIYLEPQDELRLTIRGAFPVFRYMQTHAQLYGFDIAKTIEFNDNFKLKSSYSYLRGWDLSNDKPLLFMPANQLKSSLQYSLGHWGNLQNVQVELNARYTFKQDNLYVDQDFIAPPEGYLLFGGKLSMEKPMKGYSLKFFSKIDNALNNAYRDYLNRLRYFANDLGMSILLGANIQF